MIKPQCAVINCNKTRMLLQPAFYMLRAYTQGAFFNEENTSFTA